MTANNRFDRLDALRGLALVWMAIFHFCFDLSHVGLLQTNFYEESLWTTQRILILSLFLLCAGAGQAVAVYQGRTWPHFWRRWRQVLACALLVTAGSFIMFPNSFIYFGVLHGMALMLVVARLTAQWTGKQKFNGSLFLWPLGLLAITLPSLLQHEIFNTFWLSWTGLYTQKPVTQDHVPLLPWMGLVWWGLAGMQWMIRNRPSWLTSDATLPIAKKNFSERFVWRGLVCLGTWSLTFYMLHQPVLLGTLEIYFYLVGKNKLGA